MIVTTVKRERDNLDSRNLHNDNHAYRSVMYVST
jgi:hypothetical protein